MRLIDLDEFLQQNCIDRMDGKSCEECKYHVLEVSCERLMEQPTIDPVKWIPITEKLPEKTGHYLVTAIEDGKRSVYSDDYFVYGWDDLGDEVVAWAELPEPWRGE